MMKESLGIIFLLIMLSGCVSAVYRNGERSVSYNDLFKKASDVQVNWTPEGVSIGIGNVSSELTVEDIAAYMRVMNAMAVPQ